MRTVDEDIAIETNQSLMSARAVILPRITLRVEVGVLQQNLAIVSDPDVVVVSGGAVIIIVDVHFAESDPRHAFLAQRGVPVVMHGDSQMASIFRAIVVAVPDQVNEVVPGVRRV